jgi:hypothetical protein
METDQLSIPIAADSFDQPHIAPSRREKQLSVRSTRAYELAHGLSKTLGQSMAQVIEQALDRMQADFDPVPEGLIRKGRFLVIPSDGRPAPTVEAINDLIDRIRNGEEDD